MSSGNVYERLFKLWGSIVKLILDGKRDPEWVADVLQGIVEIKTIPLILTRAVWQQVYDLLGYGFDESRWVEPAPGFWDTYVQKGVTPNRVAAAMRKLGVTMETLGVDLDASTAGRDQRDPVNGSYHIRFRATVEADEDNQNLSAEDLRRRGRPEITLTERLLLGLAHFIATEEGGQPDDHERHLDRDNITLCAGSRHFVGRVPKVYWDRHGRQVYVGWCYSASHSSFLRSRSAVSNP